MRAILLDIEGTTTPITFVLDILFPYAKTHISKFVETHFDALRHEIEQLVAESASDEKYTVPVDPTEPGSISTYLEFLIDENRKSTPLKSMQGMIWKEGYESGKLISVLFDDVAPAFEKWHDAGATIAIYSSGSILAQQLLFRHTNYGDMTPYISKYFDTTTGGKREPNSYSKIARELGREPRHVTFCSDIPAELDAARNAGLKTVLVVREGNEPVDNPESYRIIQAFDELD
jgi:enolase-phosphatase E1